MISKNRSVFNLAAMVFAFIGTEGRGQSVECESQRGSSSPCSFGDCDLAIERDLWQPGATTPMMTIRIAFIVFRDGEDKAVLETKMAAQFDRLFDDFDDYNIFFDWINSDPLDYYVDSTDFFNFCHPILGDHCICPLGSATCDPEEYDEAAMMAYGVSQTAVDPSTSLNVFLPKYSGNVSDFPWYDDVDTDYHGVRMAGSYIGDNNDCGGQPCQSLTHEVGHALGLWHTHEGNIGNQCIDCREPATCDGECEDDICDETGDLCCDTPASRTQDGCSPVGGNDQCTTESPAWPSADVENFMAYGFDGCWDHFTPQQVSRMHCWVCNAHPDWIVDDDCNNNDIPDVCEITSGAEIDCDQDGILDDCETVASSGACCLSHESDDCIKIPSSDCCDSAGGIQWYGLGTKCRDIDCFLAPSGPQGP